ncbi:MAG: S26 family signal peptidase, partial [Bifidobacteriaceae bacterium]|nr:S26 family signal peptidase [Bifidobacteriaceae bacterium]
MVQPLDGAPRHRLERGRGSKNKSKTPGRDSEEESDQDAGNKPGKKPDKKSVRFLKDAVFVVVAAIILSFLIKTFLIQSFYIPSESMEPTLEELDRVLVTKLAPGLFDVHRGD